MKDLTKQLKEKSKGLKNPLMDELKEQFEMTKNHQSLSRFSSQFETSKNTKYELC
jgi:hypothetical protein